MREQFGQALRRLRGERYLSQQDLADKAGVARTTIARAEAGLVAPFPRTVRKLAAALGVEPSMLVPGAELIETYAIRNRRGRGGEGGQHGTTQSRRGDAPLQS